MTAAPIRIRSATGTQGGCLMLFGLPFAGVGILSVTLTARDPEVPVVAPCLLSIFALIGAAIVVAGGRKVMQAARFSPVFLELDRTPALGGEVAGRLEAGFRELPASITCALECWRDTHLPRRGQHGGGTSSEKVAEVRVEVPASQISRPGPRRASVPVRIGIPGGWPPPVEGRNEQGRRTTVHWTLECTASVDGLDFHATFPLTPRP